VPRAITAGLENAIKRLVVMIACVIVMLAFATTVASAASRTNNLNDTVTGTVTGTEGWCCGTVWSFEGRAAVHSLGMVDFTGSYTSGVDPYLTFVDGQGFVHPYGEIRSLLLTFVARNGDTLVLTAWVEWSEADPAPPLVWTVSQASGRFEGYSGSGTYSVSVDGSTVAISLSGILTA